MKKRKYWIQCIRVTFEKQRNALDRKLYDGSGIIQMLICCYDILFFNGKVIWFISEERQCWTCKHSKENQLFSLIVKSIRKQEPPLATNFYKIYATLEWIRLWCHWMALYNTQNSDVLLLAHTRVGQERGWHFRLQNWLATPASLEVVFFLWMCHIIPLKKFFFMCWPVLLGGSDRW